MTMTDRDRRILLIIVPIVILVAYWFLLLSPKRDELQTAKDDLAQAEQRRDTAVNRVAVLERARETFTADYAAVVRLGKAIPTSVDSASLLVQLDQAATATNTNLSSVQFGERQSGIALPATAPEPTGQEGATSESAQPEGNAAAGGVAAATGPGQAVEAAGEGAEGAEAAQAPPAAEGTAPEAAPTQATPAGLDSVALTFVFQGTYFDIADFFHRIKRFVYVDDNRIFIRGRLATVDSVTFTPGTDAAATSTTGEITGNVTATLYLTPRDQGATAGATPAGPEGATAPPGEQPPAEEPPAGGTASRGSVPTAAARALR